MKNNNIIKKYANSIFDNVIKSDKFANTAKQKLQIGAYQNALSDLNKSINFNRFNPELYYTRALCYSELNNFANAYDDICKSINLDNQYVEAYIEKGNLDQVFGDYISAILDYTKAIELQNDNLEAYFNRGYVNLICERFEEAIADFTKVIEKRPYDADAYNNLGLAFFNKGNVTLGLSYLHRSVDLNPLSDAKENIKVIEEDMIKKFRKRKKPQ